MKAMQKDPTLRYQSAAEMLRDIDNFKKNPSISFEYQYLSNRRGGQEKDKPSPLTRSGRSRKSWKSAPKRKRPLFLCWQA